MYIYTYSYIVNNKIVSNETKSEELFSTPRIPHKAKKKRPAYKGYTYALVLTDARYTITADDLSVL